MWIFEKGGRESTCEGEKTQPLRFIELQKKKFVLN